MRGEALRWGRRWTAGALVMGTLALGGCTGDPTPGPTGLPSPPGSPTASASPSPTPIVAPVRPAEMERSDEVGAVAAAEYFMELFAYVMATGDVVEWDAVSDPACGFCAEVRGEVVRVYGAGGRFEGLILTTAGSEALGYDEVLNGYGVGVTFALPAGVELDAAGQVVDERGGESGVAVLDVTPSGQYWRLVGLSLLADAS